MYACRRRRPRRRAPPNKGAGRPDRLACVFARLPARLPAIRPALLPAARMCDATPAGDGWLTRRGLAGGICASTAKAKLGRGRVRSAEHQAHPRARTRLSRLGTRPSRDMGPSGWQRRGSACERAGTRAGTAIRRPQHPAPRALQRLIGARLPWARPGRFTQPVSLSPRRPRRGWAATRVVETETGARSNKARQAEPSPPALPLRFGRRGQLGPWLVLYLPCGERAASGTPGSLQSMLSTRCTPAQQRVRARLRDRRHPEPANRALDGSSCPRRRTARVFEGARGAWSVQAPGGVVVCRVLCAPPPLPK